MKRFIKILTLSMAAGLVTANGFALDGVVIVNDSVDVTSLNAAALKDMFTGKSMYWEGGQAVSIVYVGDKTDAALKEISGMDSSGFKTFWQRLAFSGRGQAPKKADDGAAAVALVAGTKGAIAIVPADTALTGVKTLEIK
jgi:ABC-type phosphate transport system substrate-binding protein